MNFPIDGYRFQGDRTITSAPKNLLAKHHPGPKYCIPNSTAQMWTVAFIILINRDKFGERALFWKQQITILRPAGDLLITFQDVK